MLKDRTPPCAEEIKGNEVGNMRKILRRAMLGLLCCVLLCVCVFADNSITEMKTDCNVEPDGTCRITQTLTLNLETSENELHFPLGAGAKKPEIAGYQAKQYIEDGITCLRLSSTTGFAGSRTFTVTYTLEDLVTEADGVQTLGFRRYLRRITNNHIKTMLARDPQYFYRTLPYAEAMGMGAEFAARFAALDLEPCEWFSEEKEPARNSKEFYSHWKEALAMLEVSIRK